MNKWEQEPNHKEFQYKGYDCEIKRIPNMGHLCGYVIVSINNKLFGEDDGADSLCMNLDVHGGITYGAPEPDGRWKIGFDCAHLGDYQPNTDYHFEGDTYKDMEFVTHQIKELVEQVAEYERA